MKKLPTLGLSDIQSSDISKNLLGSSKTIIGAALLTLMTACSDNDTTSYADPAQDSYDNGSYDVGPGNDSYDVGAYDLNDSDVTSYSDN